MVLGSRLRFVRSILLLVKYVKKMGGLIQYFNFLFLFRKYDLKGSTVDREASVKELEKDLPTLKDNDFMKDGTKIHIGEDAKQQLMETLTADVEVRI